MRQTAHIAAERLSTGYKLENEPIPGKPNKFYKKVVINEEEAELVRLAFNYYNKGYTKKQMADMLNEQGYRIKGKLLKGKSFDKWLTNQKWHFHLRW